MRGTRLPGHPAGRERRARPRRRAAASPTRSSSAAPSRPTAARSGRPRRSTGSTAPSRALQTGDVVIAGRRGRATAVGRRGRRRTAWPRSPARSTDFSARPAAARTTRASAWRGCSSTPRSAATSRSRSSRRSSWCMRGTAPARRARCARRNNGQRACGGTISVPAPYAMAPGGARDAASSRRASRSTLDALDRPLRRGVPGRRHARVHAQLADRRRARRQRRAAARGVLVLRPAAGRDRARRAVIGTEGSRRFGFTVRNVGTATCRATQHRRHGAPGARSGAGAARYTVPAGQSVDRRGRRSACAGAARTSGTRALIAFPRRDAAETCCPATTSRRAADGRARRATRNARTPDGAGGASRGTRGARRARAACASATLRVARVEIAVRKRRQAAAAGSPRAPATCARSTRAAAAPATSRCGCRVNGTERLAPAAARKRCRTAATRCSRGR